MPNTQTNLSSVKEQNSTKNARSYLERNVTKYTSVTETTGEPRTIARCLAFIRDNKKQAALVEALRPLYQRAEELCLKQNDEAAKAAYQEAKSEYDAAKKKLSAVTLSGTFTKRGIAGLETYSGIIQADLDHLHREGVDICELKKRLSLDPHVLFCFVSPGGDGFKIGIPVATGYEDHTEAFLAMQRYFESTYGILPDDACKDVSRLCFLSSDPEIFINENAVALNWRVWPEPAARIVEEELTRSVAGSSGSRENKPDKAAVASMLSATPKRPDYTDWLRIVAAVGDALDDDDAIEVLSAWSPEEHPGEYLEKLHSGMDQVHIGTLIHLAKANGWTDWPEIQPLPPEHPPVAPFDYGLLPSTFIPYARDVAERMQCPPDYVAVGLMCSVGSLVGRKVGIHPKRKDDWLEVCNLWGAVVGPPSIMKSPALSDAMLPLNKLVADAIERHKEDCAAFADAKEVRAAGKEARKTALTKALKELGEAAALDMAKKQRTEAKDEPICERFTVNDVTIEKLGMLLNENPNGLLQFRDELVGWLRCMDKDGHENDRAFLLECWNGKGSYTSDRVERGTQHIEAAIVGVLGGIQPGVLAKYIREASGSAGGSDGLLQRFNLIVWPEITPMFINVDRYPNKEAKEAVMAVFEHCTSLTSPTWTPQPITAPSPRSVLAMKRRNVSTNGERNLRTAYAHRTSILRSSRT